jgi:hypothetical protein
MNKPITIFSRNSISIFAICVFAVCFIVFSALYIYGINNVAMHTLGIEEGTHRLLQMEEELRILEVEKSHLTIGTWLTREAESYNLYASGPVYFLTRENAVARARY